MATSLTHLFSKDRTFRAKKRWDEGTLRHNLHKHAKATLQSGLDLKQCVKLPPNETLEDWIAVHVVDFFNRVNLIYGTISEFCTPETCPIMSGGPNIWNY
ncbi:MOB kinase activator 3B-like [Xenia sp. Carnegie-2017]|uniref:MOB kinase activator 3B-like n=1 Tax=Xenia sp. Carnegie-2017 TaxID=2897299 RepID=UPI001F03F076|nr:MOB kinase activator 3B-like [Xenia sp. Carnegie-2017]